MTLRFSGVIRRLMGWCPNAAMAGNGRFRYAVPEGEFRFEAAAGGDREVVEGALVDNGPIGTPATFFILPVAAALLIGSLFVMPPAGGLLLLALILAYSGMEVYGVLRKARIEIARDTVTIRRPLFWPVVIPKEAVSKAEVKENKLPIPFWLLTGALALIFASAAGSVYNGLDNPASIQFIFGLGGAIFFPVIFYRTYARTRYPRTLVVTTKKKIAAIYTDDPERIARALEVSR